MPSKPSRKARPETRRVRVPSAGDRHVAGTMGRGSCRPSRPESFRHGVGTATVAASPQTPRNPAVQGFIAKRTTGLEPATPGLRSRAELPCAYSPVPERPCKAVLPTLVDRALPVFALLTVPDSFQVSTGITLAPCRPIASTTRPATTSASSSIPAPIPSPSAAEPQKNPKTTLDNGCMHRGSGRETITSERLELVPLEVEHAAEMVGLLGDERLHEFIGGKPLRLDELRERYARQVAGSGNSDEVWLNWIVRRRVDSQPVGSVQATLTDGGRTAHVAWVIGVDWQRRGFGSEAAGALVGWLQRKGAQDIRALIHPDHRASAAVATRAGLEPTGEEVEGEQIWRSR